MKTALIVVDVQKDFLPGGVLGADGSDAIIEPILKLAEEADFVIASRDWHPEGHISFKAKPKFTDKSWPPHCVQGTEGAKLHPEIRMIADAIVSKGMDKKQEAYSAFDGTIDDGGQDLSTWLTEHDVEHVIVVGCVMEYCVKATAISAVTEGFRTTININAIASLGKETTDEAIKAMASKHVRISEKMPRGRRAPTREESISDAIDLIVQEAEEADTHGDDEMSSWFGSLVRWVKEKGEDTEGPITIVFPDAYKNNVRVIEIPEAQVKTPV